MRFLIGTIFTLLSACYVIGDDAVMNYAIKSNWHCSRGHHWDALKYGSYTFVLNGKRYCIKCFEEWLDKHSDIIGRAEEDK